ncbi:MAG: hypothetical protein KDC44_22845 [Phaeodactylibacter sp.]|nr:hypothetical protein [Phaeodactylibacter sp.]
MTQHNLETVEDIKTPLVERLIEKVRRSGFKKIKATLEEYEDPQSFRNMDSDRVIVPDVTAVKNGRKHYFEVALKSSAIQKVVNKWKLLSTLADTKKGKLHLYTPRGHKSFAHRLVAKYNIKAKIVSL